MRQNAVRGLVFLFIAIGVLIFGIYQVNRTTASCGGQTMHAGDTCVRTKAGVTTSRNSVSEELSSEHTLGWACIAVGAFGLLGGGIGAIRRRGQAARAGGYGNQAPVPLNPSAPPGAWPPAQQPYGPPGQPGYAQPGDQGYGQQQYPQQNPYPRQ